MSIPVPDTVGTAGQLSTQRRRFLRFLCAGAAALPTIIRASELLPKSSRRVVVIGGGFGGTIAAKYVRLLDPDIEVVLIVRDRQYVSGAFSNQVIGGLRQISDLTIGYEKLAANYSIKLIHGEATAIDPGSKEVRLADGTIGYDRLIVSPGIDLRSEEIEGYDPEIFPHAWIAGTQTALLRSQLESMPDGGKVIIATPLTPYRCPPAPYERACMVAHYLKQHKPRSKVIVLDANPDLVSMKPLFSKAWSEYYRGIIEYIPGKKVTRADRGSKAVFVEGVEEFRGNVVNLIPPQRAGNIAITTGLVGDDRKWCPVNATTFESTRHMGIHVIGDATQPPSDGPPMPKTGFSASTQAKICARNVVALMNGGETTGLSGINVSYSAISDHESVSLAQVFKLVNGKIKSSYTAISPADFSAARMEHVYADHWIRNTLAEMSS